MVLHLSWLLTPGWVAAADAASSGWLDGLREGLGTFGLIALVAAITVVVTLTLVRWSFIRPIHRTARWLEAQRLGSVSSHPILAGGVFGPLWRELAHLLTSLATARAAAEEEARLREAGAADWTADRLRAHVSARIDGAPLFVVSNREPYMHVHARGNNSNGGVECLVPASGLVTAL